MIDFPISKINLGLNIVSRRDDGYHNLETVFYPIPLKDTLEVHEMEREFPSAVDCDIKVTNMHIDGNEQDNLIIRAYNLLAKKIALPRLHVHLHKDIPCQAGLGGGSSDCAYMIRLLNRELRLDLDNAEMMELAAGLGADCPFFILGTPAYAEGIGEKLSPIDIDLHGWTIGIVCPHIPVSTKEAFSRITPHPTTMKCRDIVKLPVEKWRGLLTNDFEESVFALHPQIMHIKQKLYEQGATYAAMSGSGSSVFGLFRTKTDLQRHFPDTFTFCALL